MIKSDAVKAFNLLMKKEEIGYCSVLELQPDDWVIHFGYGEIAQPILDKVCFKYNQVTAFLEGK